MIGCPFVIIAPSMHNKREQLHVDPQHETTTATRFHPDPLQLLAAPAAS